MAVALGSEAHIEKVSSRFSSVARGRLGLGVGVVLLLLFFGLTNVWFTSVHREVNAGDEQAHLVSILLAHHGGFGAISSNQYPPFFYVISVLTHHVLGVSRQASVAANLPFLAALLWGVAGIVRRRTGNNAAALTAAFLAAAYPLSAALSRMAMLDFALVGMVALALWLLLETDSFRRPRPTLLFAVVCGLGQLTRGSFFLFLAAPTLLSAGRLFWVASGRDLRRRLALACGAGVVALAIALVWYGPGLGEKIAFGASRVSQDPNQHFAFGSKAWFFFYPYALIDGGLGWVGALGFALALPFALRRGGFAAWTTLAGIAAAWLVFSQFPWKLLRYVAPLVGFFAVLTGIGLGGMRAAWPRRAVLGAVTLLALLQFCAVTFGTPAPHWFTRNGVARYATFGLHLAPSAYYEDLHLDPPNPPHPPTERLVRFITGLKNDGPHDKLIVVRLLWSPPDWPRQSPFESALSLPLSYYIVRDQLPLTLVNCWRTIGPMECDPNPVVQSPANLDQADIVFGHGPDPIAQYAIPGAWEKIAAIEQDPVARDQPLPVIGIFKNRH